MNLQWQVGDRIQGHWEIHKILRGGMGIVYVVYDHELHEVSGAKTFQDEVFELHPESADRFRREALTWLQLGVHQNVTEARILEVIQGKPYLFLEYVGGGSLRHWIGTRRLTEDLPCVLLFALHFCDGMTHALANGIRAHRDIKPDNCCGFRGKPATIPESFRPPFRNDCGHHSGVKLVTNSDAKPAALSQPLEG